MSRGRRALRCTCPIVRRCARARHRDENTRVSHQSISSCGARADCCCCLFLCMRNAGWCLFSGLCGGTLVELWRRLRVNYERCLLSRGSAARVHGCVERRPLCFVCLFVCVSVCLNDSAQRWWHKCDSCGIGHRRERKEL